jgi:hypothetical protein
MRSVMLQDVEVRNKGDGRGTEQSAGKRNSCRREKRVAGRRMQMEKEQNVSVGTRLQM